MDTVPRCERCHHPLAAAGSVAAGLGPVCRRRRARGVRLVDHLLNLSEIVDKLSLPQLAVLAAGLDDIEAGFEAVSA